MNKLVLIDNEPYKIEEYDENNDKAIISLMTDLQYINEINNQMNILILTQGEKLNESQTNIESTVAIVNTAMNELSIASDYQKSYLWRKNIFVTICTSAIAIPIAVFAGLKCALIVGAGFAGTTLYNL